MFNTRDEIIDLSEFYNPYRVGGNVENINTGEIANIVCIDSDIATLQMNIDKDLDSTEYLKIEVSKLKREWKKCEKIIIGKLPSKEERFIIGLDFSSEDIGFEVVENDIGKPVIVSKSKVKRKKYER